MAINVEKDNLKLSWNIEYIIEKNDISILLSKIHIYKVVIFIERRTFNISIYIFYIASMHDYHI